MFPDEKNQISPKLINVSHQKKIIFPGIIDIFGGKKSAEGMINLGDEMISLGG